MPTAAFATIEGDGTISKRSALELFATSFGAMPGVDAPAATSGGRSATLALRAIEHFAPELSDAQRARIDDVRNAATDGDPFVVEAGHRRAAAPSATVDPTAKAAVRASAAGLRSDIAERLGGDISGPIAVAFAVANDADEDQGVTEATWAAGGSGYTGCKVVLFPIAFDPGRDPRTTLAHEMVHCFQAAAYGDDDAWRTAPSWLLEGSAEWAGATLGSADAFDALAWQRYLTTPETDLRTRTYDAIAFYSHLEETGRSPWLSFRKMWVTGLGSIGAITASGADEGDFLDSWAPSATRRTDLGNGWDTTGPGVTTDKPHRKVIDIDAASEPVAAAPYALGLYDLVIGTDAIRVSVTGHGRLADGTVDATIADASLFCIRDGGCTCPDGTGPSVPPVPLSRTNATIALTGGPAGTSGTVQGLDLDALCTTPETQPTLDACDLITDSEAAKLLGVAIDRVEPTATGVDTGCIKGTPRTSDPAAFTYVSVGILHDAAAFIDSSLTQPGARAAPFGDRAVLVPDAGAAFVQVGDLVLAIVVVVGGRPGGEALVTGAADLAAARVPR